MTTNINGGVLGDVIGSGKTVVTISLILSAMQTARENHSIAEGKSGATLIVVPPGLVKQWDDERRKFSQNTLKSIIIDSTDTLMRFSVKEICKADILALGGQNFEGLHNNQLGVGGLVRLGDMLERMRDQEIACGGK